MKKLLVYCVVIGLLWSPSEALAHGGRGGGGGGGGGASVHSAPHAAYHAPTFSRPSAPVHSAAPAAVGGRSFAEHAAIGRSGGVPVGGLGGRSFAAAHTGFRPNGYGNWYHGNWQGHSGRPWGYWPVGWGGYGYGNGFGWGLGIGAGLATVGLMAATSPYNWGYYNYSNPYSAGPVAGMPYIDYSQPMIGQPYGAYGGQGYAGQGYGGQPYGGQGYGGAPIGGQPLPGQPIAGQPMPGQPIAGQPLPPTASLAGNPAADSQQQAMTVFDAARNQFLYGNYKGALEQVNQALALAPKDPVLNEFRGLCLFAVGDYQQAAAADYAVLSAGPGWDWTTMSNFYPNVDAYTQQLRALENYSQQHPNAADARFLLAYQYLREGYNDQATAELQAVAQLEPRDQLSAQLLRGLTTPPPGDQPPGGQLPDGQLADNQLAGGQLAGGQPPGGQFAGGPGGQGFGAPGAPPGQSPQTAQPQQAARPIDPGGLQGNWSASRPDGSTFKLQLSSDSKFTWKFGAKDKQQTLTGTYTLADNYLILKGSDQNTLVGQVTPDGSNRFNFRLAGNNPADPGLDFSR
ncbi:MAG TPA: hypothetical protein VHY20_00755 [Pirellulales bacterium]|nr:hypothetical protein [Pirellulales bacterium]